MENNQITFADVQEMAHNLQEWWGIADMTAEWDIQKKTNDPTEMKDMGEKTLKNCANILDFMVEDIRKFQQMVRQYADTIE